MADVNSNNHPFGAEAPADAENQEPIGEPLKVFIDHQRKALEETGKALDALVPDGFKEHSAEARREFVKGMKVLVDAALSELEKTSREFDKNFTRRPAPASPGDDKPSSTGATKVKVQVD
ncbi:MAG: hypothetical protein IPK19_37280 [Chloroflexi bacterium]|nr:hypothetical protein [Chloroflexota bacterium]